MLTLNFLLQSNMHTNTNAAHNYSNQHPFSLNISSGNPGQFTNQNQEQPPASNHPVTNPAAGQGYNLQKSNNVSNYYLQIRSCTILSLKPFLSRLLLYQQARPMLYQAYDLSRM